MTKYLFHSLTKSEINTQIMIEKWNKDFFPYFAQLISEKNLENSQQKMLESRPEDALVKLVLTVLTVVTALTVLTEDLKKALTHWLTDWLSDNLKARDASASKNYFLLTCRPIENRHPWRRPRYFRLSIFFASSRAFGNLDASNISSLAQNRTCTNMVHGLFVPGTG